MIAPVHRARSVKRRRKKGTSRRSIIMMCGQMLDSAWSVLRGFRPMPGEAGCARWSCSAAGWLAAVCVNEQVDRVAAKSRDSVRPPATNLCTTARTHTAAASSRGPRLQQPLLLETPVCSVRGPPSTPESGGLGLNSSAYKEAVFASGSQIYLN
nr:apoptosis regulatory protein Siva isoform X2 [Syngnathus scovelli]